MGMRIAAHEVYFGTFFERFNMRFGPSLEASGSVWQSGGVAEIAALQRQFHIFRPGRAFMESAALLGLGGLVSSPAKDRWVEYLGRLPHMASDEGGQSGDERIVGAIARNLGEERPLPCFMQAHDGRKKEPGQVVVQAGRPLFYLGEVTFLTISLPMRPMGEAGR